MKYQSSEDEEEDSSHLEELRLEEERKREEKKRNEERKLEEERKKKEMAEKEEENRRKRREAKEMREREDDTPQLENLKPDENCIYVNQNDAVFESFEQLSLFTREYDSFNSFSFLHRLQTERAWQTPEIVLIGHDGSGKTGVLEMILGHAVSLGNAKSFLIQRSDEARRIY